MPHVIETQVDEAIEIGDLVAYLNDAKIDTSDHAAMIEAGPMLRRLSNNRNFLADIALRELKDRSDLNVVDSYSPQVMMLYHPANHTDQNFFLRANIWPSPRDHIFMSSGAEQFLYHKPHDHSFNFLTVGHFGPGYKSNYFEYEYGETAGFPGERVSLKFIEQSALEEGKVMLYRACVDVHDQIPGDSLSISINIMEQNSRASLQDQYGFDVETGVITELINRVPATVLLPLIAQVGEDDAIDFLMETARTHPIGRTRCSAIGAIAGAQVGFEDAMRVFEEGARNDFHMVRGWCRYNLERMAAHIAA